MRGEAGEDAVVITVTCMAEMKMGREIGWGGAGCVAVAVAGI